MYYDIPKKGEDGLYHVRAYTDDKTRYMFQVNDVKILDVSQDIMIEPTDSSKFDEINEINIQSAVENCSEWFGRKLAEKTIKSAYTSDKSILLEKIEATKVFNSDKQEIQWEDLTVETICSVIVEFGGLWFAKKAFGPVWNVVQVKVHPTPEPEPEPTDDIISSEPYPDAYMFEDTE